jgi:hypothetical protein
MQPNNDASLIFSRVHEKFSAALDEAQAKRDKAGERKVRRAIALFLLPAYRHIYTAQEFEALKFGLRWADRAAYTHLMVSVRGSSSALSIEPLMWRWDLIQGGPIARRMEIVAFSKLYAEEEHDMDADLEFIH